jgi:predicted transcriptional regulator
METAEGIDHLFYDFSSESRLGIIRELTQQNLRMKDLARKLDLTPTEVFRQLQRLVEASVIQKLPDGTYKITNYGKLTVQLLPSLEFTFRHKAYFINHDVSRIPYPFINRIGELSESTLCMNPIETINRSENILKEVENYAWLMAEKPLESGSLAKAERDPERIRFRFLLSEFPQSFPAVPTIEKRTFPSIPCTILCTEKEAGVGLMSTEGRIDYTGFFSKDPMFVTWARDLFLHYWNLGKPW